MLNGIHVCDWKAEEPKETKSKLMSENYPILYEWDKNGIWIIGIA